MVAFVRKDVGKMPEVEGATFVGAHGGTFVFKKGNAYAIVSMSVYDTYEPPFVQEFVGKKVTDAFVQRFVVRFYFEDGSRFKVKADPNGQFAPTVAVMVVGGDGGGGS